MSAKFAVGEVVRLKSGGPEMTVCNVLEDIDDDRVRCQWFAGNKLQDGWFNPESLVKVGEDNG